MAVDPQGTVSIDVLVSVIAIVQLLVHGLLQIVQAQFAKGKQDPVLSEIKGLAQQGAAAHDENARFLRELYDMHRVIDPKDGRLIWYFPNSMGEMQRDQMLLLRQLADAQRDLAKMIETLTKQSDRAELRAERRFDGPKG